MPMLSKFGRNSCHPRTVSSLKELMEGTKYGSYPQFESSIHHVERLLLANPGQRYVCFTTSIVASNRFFFPFGQTYIAGVFVQWQGEMASCCCLMEGNKMQFPQCAAG